MNTTLFQFVTLATSPAKTADVVSMGSGLAFRAPRNDDAETFSSDGH